jgi:endogenous inhibitor of DNA gyrase (YacG/DUF329 family)
MPDTATTLRCAECGTESTEGARGWRALLGVDDDDREEVVVLCPTCANREFGAGE